MKAFWITVALSMTLMMAACAPIAAPGDPVPATDAAATPVTDPTSVPAEEPAAAPTSVPAEAPTVPAEPAAGDDGEIGELVRQVLMQQLQVNATDVEIVSVEPVEWPDACLGISSPDVMCAQVITPGYRVVLAADGQEYAYHTNADGSNIQPAPAP